MENDTELVLGVDGGGSTTFAAVATLNGEILGRGSGGPSRIGAFRRETVEDEIDGVIAGALTEASADRDQLVAAGFGLGGLDTESFKRQAREIAGSVLPSDCRIRIENDATSGLYSGTFGGGGICVIAGTGSLISGIDSSGRQVRVDGWGHLFGDLGSAYFVGREGVKAALEYHDGRGERTALKERIASSLDLESIEDVLDRFQGREDAPTRIAALAPLVDAAAEEGDAVSLRVLETAAEELVRSVRALVNRIDLTDLQPLELVQIGGVFESTHLREHFQSRIRERVGEVRFIRPEWGAVVGALVIALLEVDRPPDETTRKNLTRSV